MLVTKQDGMREPFDPQKLRRSLRHAGCSEKICTEVIAEVERTLTEGESTTKVYKTALKLLRKKEKPLAARYSMKRAVLALGPTGFPFEEFVGELFRAQGYDVEVGKPITGVCAPHEVDVVARKEDRCIGAELKFHNKLGYKTDLKVALYVLGRFEDIKRAHPLGHLEGGVDEGWLITNTAFTGNARRYGECVGLHLVSWDYPARGNLEDLITKAKVQPVTALTTLSRSDRSLLMKRGIVLCRTLPERRRDLDSLGLPEDRIRAAIEEARALCGI